MEEEMVDDNGVSEAVEFVFTAYEIDLDYEFDAPRFFDFIREESPLEVRQAEAWFDSAGGYPPSPFVARLVRREKILMQNIRISSNCRDIDSMNLCESDFDGEAVSTEGMHYGGRSKGTSSNVFIGIPQNIQKQSQKLTGSTFYNHFENNINSETQTKVSVKSTFPRNSTLMKPTASHLAKQNHPFQAGYSRSHTSLLDGTSKTSTSSSGIENQAAKRQKLDGGLLRKVMGTVQLQHANFVHKAPKSDKLHYENTTPIKPRITIPRDPVLETARRAQRAMEISSKVESVNSTVRRFKALPLNRKILETPSLLPKRSTPPAPDFQEFHLKTSERAVRQSSSVLKSTVPGNHPNQKELHKYSTNLAECGSREPGSIANTPSRLDCCQLSHSFKAFPLNRKILTSKRDIGASISSKNETMEPMEFNFQTEARFHPTPPVELFNKLSLASETKPAANPERNGL